MAAEAAQRAGAGYVTVCVPATLNLVFEVRLLEVMSRPLPGEEEGRLGAAAVEPVLEACERADALVLGPGLGRAEASLEFARAVARAARVPMLLDADGLNAHAERLSDLAVREAPAVLTPHAGELARLLDTDSQAIEAERLRHVREAAEAAQAVVVLKGDDTLVAEPGGLVGVSAGGSAALATAGTGDVLSGITGSLLAKGLDAFAAACAAVWLHAAAGRRAATLRGPDSVIARDVIEALPRELADSRGG
jgi:NAD(P)H-hydrate epimerase